MTHEPGPKARIDRLQARIRVGAEVVALASHPVVHRWLMEREAELVQALLDVPGGDLEMARARVVAHRELRGMLQRIETDQARKEQRLETLLTRKDPANA